MKNTICTQIKPLLLEYTDGALSKPQSSIVISHLKQCAECRVLAHDFESTKSLLRNMPERQLSTAFDTRLSERLATIKVHELQPTWQDRVATFFRTRSTVLKPALAFCAALFVVTGTTLYLQTPPSLTAGPKSVPPASDTPLISQCVQIHQSDVAAQPLSDVSAQNLASRLDTSATGTQAVPKEIYDQSL